MAESISLPRERELSGSATKGRDGVGNYRSTPINRLIIWLVERQIKNGWLPRDWFYASAYLFGAPCIELYICRRTPQGREQVYLIPRSKDDPFFSSQLHMPGVRKITSETDKDHLRRALRETPFKLSHVDVEYVASTTLKIGRGTEYADIRRIVVPYDPAQTDFYDVDKLPGNIVAQHRGLIAMLKGLK